MWSEVATSQRGYSIAQDKETLVSDYLDSSGNSIPWNPSFTKAFQDSKQCFYLTWRKNSFPSTRVRPKID
jgi:hypothetical protein